VGSPDCPSREGGLDTLQHLNRLTAYGMRVPRTQGLLAYRHSPSGLAVLVRSRLAVYWSLENKLREVHDDAASRGVSRSMN